MSEVTFEPQLTAFEPVVDANQAFSVDQVLRFGVAFLRESPRVALLGGAILAATQVLPSFVGICANVGSAFATAGDPKAAQIANIGVMLLQYGLQALMLPVALVVQVGLTAAAAEHVRTGETSPRTLALSVLPFVRTMMYRLLVSFIELAIVSVTILLPLVLLLAAAVVTERPIPFAVVAIAWTLVLGFLFSVIVGLGTQLGSVAANVDDVWPVDALVLSWRSASGARLTLFATNLVFGVLLFLSAMFSFLLIGLVPLVLIGPVMNGGFAIAWLLHTTPEAERRTMPFFGRHAPVV